MSSFYQAEVVDYLENDVNNSTYNNVAMVSRKILGLHGTQFVSESEYRKYREYFGCSIDTKVALWILLSKFTDIGKAKVKHLLWTLLFMKVYTTESVLCGLVGHPSEKTFRKWTKLIIEQIASLEEFLVSQKRMFIICFTCLFKF